MLVSGPGRIIFGAKYFWRKLGFCSLLASSRFFGTALVTSFSIFIMAVERRFVVEELQKKSISHTGRDYAKAFRDFLLRHFDRYDFASQEFFLREGQNLATRLRGWTKAKPGQGKTSLNNVLKQGRHKVHYSQSLYFLLVIKVGNNAGLLQYKDFST